MKLVATSGQANFVRFISYSEWSEARRCLIAITSLLYRDICHKGFPSTPGGIEFKCGTSVSALCSWRQFTGREHTASALVASEELVLDSYTKQSIYILLSREQIAGQNHILHLRQQCHNPKSAIFQERLLKVLKYYNFLWVQRRHKCSPAASFANCVVTLYLLKVHLQTFLSTPIPQKWQIFGCEILVANERYHNNN